MLGNIFPPLYDRTDPRARARATPIDGIEPEGFRAREDSVTGGCARCARVRVPARRSIRTRRPPSIIGRKRVSIFREGGGRPRETLPARLSSAQAARIRVAIETRVRERVNARRSPPHVYPRALAIIVADR